MAIGKRIKHIRNSRGLTQKELGAAIGFEGKTADVRIAQYESETRVPKDKLLAEIAEVLDVSPNTLAVPDIDSYIGVMHTLFALEDIYGLKIDKIDGELCLTLDKDKQDLSLPMLDMLQAWQKETEKFKDGEISRQEYDDWRYNYPEREALRIKENLDTCRKGKKINSRD